jgi:hypothetical protein
MNEDVTEHKRTLELLDGLSRKQRPLVDEHSWDLAEWFLECEADFNELREDIRVDLKWELADVVQKAVEDYLTLQFPQRKVELSAGG